MPCPGDPGPRPAFIKVNDTARVVFKYLAMGQTIENVFWFSRPGGYVTADLVELAEECGASWVTNLKPLILSIVQLVDITATDAEVQNGNQAQVAMSQFGSNANGPLETPGTTFAIKFATARIGRSYRGRMYWPLLDTTHVNDGALAANHANALVAAVGNFFNDVQSVTGSFHVIASYQNDCAWRAEGVATPVTSYSYSDLNLDSQRRRLPGRGI